MTSMLLLCARGPRRVLVCADVTPPHVQRTAPPHIQQLILKNMKQQLALIYDQHADVTIQWHADDGPVYIRINDDEPSTLE